MFRTFSPVPLADKTKRWAYRIQAHYPNVFGFSAFGDLFVCSQDGRQVAVVMTNLPKLEQLNFDSIESFTSTFLTSAGVVEHVLRQSDYEHLVSKLGPLSDDQCFFPVPFQRMGGSGTLDTYDKGDVWVHLDLLGQVMGLSA
ncbi:T6SS immunity protein Tdi1 domain-containing protein [Rhodanobacter denitrificans]|uniref:T6SS immunity protein Tdi1 C-terminal domain-containing protein n=1 Tax=Rhodanobacter denitrificans TaxID=666685 RepID=M4NMS8_9GAMM|nr:T6SS immunity protein Tdi1 domain-containing protein [Rhodanobacter denitrificans]AGG90948.1 protein of unknown function (DUF1851) [Rhodanobacter denitrificans]UJM86317.1 DUF1851 domain-containing protein [Rhodanobacter denitrificans]